MRKSLLLVFLLLIVSFSPSLSYAEQTDTEEIIKLKEEIRKNPGNALSHRLLASAYGKTGKGSEATAELNEAIRLEQINTKANKNIENIPIKSTAPDAVADDNSWPPPIEETTLNDFDTGVPPANQNKPSSESAPPIPRNTTESKTYDPSPAEKDAKADVSLMKIFNDLPILSKWFIGVMLAAGIFIHLLKFTPKTVAHGPTIFTTCGIFATFLGIALGLLDFKVDNVQGSIPKLLDGLKMAFWASVFGVGIALTFKTRFAIWGVPSKKREDEIIGATIDDLFNQMKAVQMAIIGNDDSTLLSQMKLTRQDTNDRLDALKRSQEAFMEKMAENNSRALIEALKEVIRDFNAKINEQFGENFKQLNQAVGEILAWQEKYRLQMAEMIEQQTKTSSNMATAAASYEEILNSAKNFWIVAERFAPIIETLNTQRNQIERSLTSLGQLLTTASGSLPAVEKKIVELTEQMTRGVRASNEESSKAIRETTAALQNIITETQKKMAEMIQKTNQDFNTHITNITNKTQEQIKTLDSALENELTKSLNTFAKQLATLSGKFVDDYTPLTKRLGEILKICEGLR